ncbi:inversin-like [Mytilus edulis]|uniref:inversin-like n=1 Tax=Mytilus edulis TaxID=6550 RepID=UPI0039EEA99B
MKTPICDSPDAKRSLHLQIEKASQQGHTDIVKLLLERNPDVNLCDNDGYSPLIKASACGHTDIVRLLLERNPVPCDSTPLSTSYAYNNISISNSPSLLQPSRKHKPDINAQTWYGGNALYVSALNGNIDITQLLLQNNADSNICIYSKQYIAEMIKNHPTETLGELKQNIFDTLVKSTASRVTEYVGQKSVNYAFDVVAGSSPLHIACFMGRLDIVCCLLDNNANINITKEDGTTPLFYSCEVGHEDIVRLLLDKEAETKICRLDGKSPLKIAIDNKHTAIVEIVTEHIHRTEPLL